jgi:hypothetical protein
MDEAELMQSDEIAARGPAMRKVRSGEEFSLRADPHQE